MRALQSRGELESLLEKEPYLLLDFTATWCGPCLQLKPILEWVEASYTKLVVVTIDVDKFNKLYKEYNVKNIPTICFMAKGKEVKRHVGVPPMEELRKMVRDFLGVKE